MCFNSFEDLLADVYRQAIWISSELSGASQARGLDWKNKQCLSRTAEGNKETVLSIVLNTNNW